MAPDPIARTRVLVGCVLTLACIASCGSSAPASMAGNPNQLVSHIPDVVNRAARLGYVDSDRALTLSVALPLRNEDNLNDTLSALYDPQSASYHQFLTPEQFAATYHPANDDVTQVGAALEAAGMQVTNVHGAFIEVSATAAQVQSFFSTELVDYTAADGQKFQAPNGDVSVPQGLPIRAVHGLTNGLRHRSHRIKPKAGRGGSAALVPSTIRSVYNIPTTLTGTGQSVGLFEFDGYTASDITGYESTYNLPNVKITNIDIDNFNGSAGDAADEVTLDIQMEMAMAPGVDEIRVYLQSPTGSDINMLNEITNPTQGDKKLIPIISCSFGNAEDQVDTANLQSDNVLFKQMAAQGQTFYDASGDSGANEDGKKLSVDEYAGQPYVVAVGGTTLTQSSGVYGSETAWVDGGGGVSGVWPMPTWQQNNIVSTATKGSQTMRNEPDVALDSDPATGYTFFFQGQVQAGGGGTSFAAPLWAGFHALVNQQRVANGLTTTGFISPLLYTLGTSTAYAGAMHDIADNSTNGFYPAVANFDDATGWGTINGKPLIAALSVNPNNANGGSAGTTGGTTGGSAGTNGAGTTDSVQGLAGSTSTSSCATAGGGTFVWLFAAVFLSRRTRRTFTRHSAKAAAPAQSAP